MAWIQVQTPSSNVNGSSAAPLAAGLPEQPQMPKPSAVLETQAMGPVQWGQLATLCRNYSDTQVGIVVTIPRADIQYAAPAVAMAFGSTLQGPIVFVPESATSHGTSSSDAALASRVAALNINAVVIQQGNPYLAVRSIPVRGQFEGAQVAKVISGVMQAFSLPPASGTNFLPQFSLEGLLTLPNPLSSRLNVYLKQLETSGLRALLLFGDQQGLISPELKPLIERAAALDLPIVIGAEAPSANYQRALVKQSPQVYQNAPTIFCADIAPQVLLTKVAWALPQLNASIDSPVSTMRNILRANRAGEIFERGVLTLK